MQLGRWASRANYRAAFSSSSCLGRAGPMCGGEALPGAGSRWAWKSRSFQAWRIGASKCHWAKESRKDAGKAQRVFLAASSTKVRVSL